MSESLADAINSAPPEKRKEILSQLKRWTRKEDNTMKVYFDETVEKIGAGIAFLALVFSGIQSIPSVDWGVPYSLVLTVFGFGFMIYTMGSRGKKGADVEAIKAGGNRIIMEFKDGFDLKDFVKAYESYREQADKPDDE